MFWDGGLVLPLHCQLFSKKVQRIQEAAKSSKAVLHFWWKRCQLNKTERPQLCMISITLLAETTHLTWPENFSIYLSQKNWAFLVFQGINQDVVPAVCNVAFRSKKAQTDIWLKRTCSFQCMLPAHTTLYTLSYIVLHCTYSVCHTQTDIWLYESLPVCDSEKNGDGGREILFSELIQGSGRRQAEIHGISDISRILLKSWQCSQNNSERWFETVKLEILFLWHSKKFATWKYMEDK